MWLYYLIFKNAYIKLLLNNFMLYFENIVSPIKVLSLNMICIFRKIRIDKKLQFMCVSRWLDTQWSRFKHCVLENVYRAIKCLIIYYSKMIKCRLVVWLCINLCPVTSTRFSRNSYDIISKYAKSIPNRLNIWYKIYISYTYLVSPYLC